MECKNISGTQFRRYLFSERLIWLITLLSCEFVFRYFGVKYFPCSYISVLFIRIRPSGLWTPTNPQSDFIPLKHVKAWLNFWSRPPAKIVFILRPCILILKVAKNFRQTFFRGVKLIWVEVM